MTVLALSERSKFCLGFGETARANHLLWWFNVHVWNSVDVMMTVSRPILWNSHGRPPCRIRHAVNVQLILWFDSSEITECLRWPRERTVELASINGFRWLETNWKRLPDIHCVENTNGFRFYWGVTNLCNSVDAYSSWCHRQIESKSNFDAHRVKCDRRAIPSFAEKNKMENNSKPYPAATVDW